MNVKGDVTNSRTGRSLPALCRKATCVACNRIGYRKDFCDAVRLARPTHMILLTGLAGAWEENQRKVGNLLLRLSRRGFSINLVYAVEINPRRTGFHAHGWMYDAPADSALWTHLAHEVGLGGVRIKPVAYTGNFAYPIKALTWNSESVAQHRLLNGKHRVHPTRGFWRDARSGDVWPAMQHAAVAWRGLTREEKAEWAYTSRRRRGSALTPRAAASIRARRDEQRRVAWAVVGSGEVVGTTVGSPMTAPLGEGTVRRILVFVTTAGRRVLVRDGALAEVEQVAA